MATGDNLGAIQVWEPAEGGKWAVDKNAPCVNGHDSSVEDIQWSPAERDEVRALRRGRARACGTPDNARGRHSRRRCTTGLQRHQLEPPLNYMLADGADDGIDADMGPEKLRRGGGGVEAARGRSSSICGERAFHRGPVTSVSSGRDSPSRPPCSPPASADHTVCVWDLAVERDAEEEAAAMAAEGNAVAPEDLPLSLFVHQGLRDPRSCTGTIRSRVCASPPPADGFNAFKAYNVGNEVQ